MSLIVASVHGEVPANIQGADLLEIRIDGFGVDEAIERLPKLLDSCEIPTVITCRSKCEGGMFDDDEESRVKMYRAALDCDNPPRYIDVEHEVLTRHPLMLDVLESETTDIILSWHDINGRPHDLIQRAAAMQDVAGVSIVKMVWRARSIRDNLEAFSLLQSRQQPMIAMCMGEFGLMSRVLAPKFGGFAVFASVDGMQKTAQGQVELKQLRSLYHFDAINSDTKVYGVIGNNVAHSSSPAFHNAAFEAAGKNAVYLPLSIPSGWEHLKASVLALCNDSSMNFEGASVTIPHKENMMQLVDVPDDNCKEAGATNTATFKDGHIFGNNTDVEALRGIAPNAKRVLILGGGGVARSAITAMSSNGADVFVVTRRTEQQEQLEQELSCSIAPEDLSDIDTVINCTPVGMEGGNDEFGNPLSQLAPSVSLTSSITVIDTVYKPVDTPLVQLAKTTGCTVVTGNEMFRLQAAAQQLIWAKN
jgi:3-dehydroquinate dehydratase/shikimate dehydrogenase